MLCLLNDGWTGKLRIQVRHSNFFFSSFFFFFFYSGVRGWRVKQGEGRKFLSVLVITPCLKETGVTLIRTVKPAFRLEQPAIIWVFLLARKKEEEKKKAKKTATKRTRNVQDTRKWLKGFVNQTSGHQIPHAGLRYRVSMQCLLPHSTRTWPLGQSDGPCGRL